MRKQNFSHQLDRQKLVHYLEKTTQMLLNVFSMIKVSPSMIQISNVVDYAKNLEVMMQELWKMLPKKCVMLNVMKKVEQESMEKSDKIARLMQSEKNLKIEVKVLEDRIQQLERKLRQKQLRRQPSIPQSLQKILTQKPHPQSQPQPLSPLHPQRLSLHSVHFSSHVSSRLQRKQSVQKPSKPTKPKPQKNYFVQLPGQGNQLLIQHLMMKKAGNNR